MCVSVGVAVRATRSSKASRSIESSVQESVSGLKSGLDSTAAALTSSHDRQSDSTAAGVSTPEAGDYSWEGADSWHSRRFERRYKPGPSIDELSEEIARLKRQLAMPAASGVARHKFSPRARVNRTRIRR